MNELHQASRIKGSLLGGAIGDALGAPVEFTTSAQLQQQCPGGVNDFLPAAFSRQQGVGLVTDDTQMTLFTAEGIIRAQTRALTRGLGFTNSVVHHALLRWYDTQVQSRPQPTGEYSDKTSSLGWLAQQSWLYASRAPGNTCLSALAPGLPGYLDTHGHFGDHADNASKGCGGVMRSAPYGWLSMTYPLHTIYELAYEAAGYTHGHPTGKSASGALAVLIGLLFQDRTLEHAVRETIEFLVASGPDAAETAQALRAAVALFTEGDSDTPGRYAIERLGQGWIAEEALSMAVYAALRFSGTHQCLQALSCAVTHGGDSDSTGSICGNILGALHGERWLDASLAFRVEGRAAMLEIADDFSYLITDGSTPSDDIPVIVRDGRPLWETSGTRTLLDCQEWFDRYPPG